MMGNSKSFNLLVGTLDARACLTSNAVSNACNTRCFFTFEVNTMGMSVKGDVRSRIISSMSRMVLVPSALVSLTSLFGMGRGGPHRNRHLSFK